MGLVRGVQMPLLREELCAKFEAIAAMRSSIGRVESDEALKRLAAEVADELCYEIENSGVLRDTRDPFAYFRLRMDAVKLLTFLGDDGTVWAGLNENGQRVLDVVSERDDRLLPFWSQLHRWPSTSRSTRRDNRPATEAGAPASAASPVVFLQSLHLLAATRGPLSKAAMLTNLELSLKMRAVHFPVVSLRGGGIGANDMSISKLPSYGRAFFVSCLAFGLPWLACRNTDLDERDFSASFDIFNAAITNKNRLSQLLAGSNSVLQFALSEHWVSITLANVRDAVGDDAARDFVALKMMREPHPALFETDIRALFGREEADDLLKARKTALLCRMEIRNCPFARKALERR